MEPFSSSQDVKIGYILAGVCMPERFRLCLAGLIVATMLAAHLPVAANAPADKLRRLIETSKILPRDYLEHVNISIGDAVVSLSLYRDPQAERDDCKIDAILLTRKVIDADPAVRKVSVAFYD